MKNVIYILFVVVTLFSCADKNKQLNGTWIEKDNFRNPKIFKFTENTFQVFEGKYLVTEKIFLIKKDTFITDDYDEIHKNRISLTGNILSFIELNSDTAYYSLEKGDFDNSLDYFNYKKRTNISLPKLNSEEIREKNHMNSIYIDSQGEIYFNGEKTKINDLESKLIPHDDFDIIQTSIFCDKTVCLFKLQEIKNELIKSQYYFVTYITLNNENQFEGINVRLPRINESQIIDELISENNFETLICLITNDKIELNGNKISSDQLYQTLKKKIATKKKELNVCVHFDNKLNYETYVKEFYNIRNAYYSVRKEYSKIKFGDSDYEALDDSIISKIKEIYPMRFAEINENAYKRLKYAP
jgi:biopolymer transport protein ExbD